jgi:predicted XRE-type DNA-binding protein
MRNGSPDKNRVTKTPAKESVRFERGSGNVFADLGVANPDVALAKAVLVGRIRHLIAERKLTQIKAAKLLGIDQPKVSALVRGRVEGYSIDRLFRFLNALGQRVQIIVEPDSRDPRTRRLRLSRGAKNSAVKAVARQNVPNSVRNR